MREQIKKLTPNFIKELYKRVRYLWITALFFLMRVLKTDESLVVCCNVWGYGDNAKYVANALKKNYGDRMKIAFVTGHTEQVPKGIRALKTNSFAAIKALATAKVWVDCNRKEPYIRKRKGQYYIQLWHGGVALKKIEGDCLGELSVKYLKNAKRDSAMTDLFVSNSRFCTEMYRRAFWADCEIAEYGSPRNDELMGGKGSPRTPEGLRVSVKEEGKNAVPVYRAVYAPTYRKNTYRYDGFSVQKVKDALGERFGGEWEILIRLHPLVISKGESCLPDGAKDVSGAPDLYEILRDADVLITDYSNTMFEFAMAGGNVFLFAADAKEYESTRGLYFPYDTLPYPKAENEEELCQKILTYDEKEYRREQSDFFDRLGMAESGRAAECVADRVAAVVTLTEEKK